MSDAELIHDLKLLAEVAERNGMDSWLETINAAIEWIEEIRGLVIKEVERVR